MEIKEQMKIETYRQCFAAKHHYDILSWSISGGLFVIQAALVTAILKIDIEYLWLRILFGILGILIACIWFLVYERNRFWGEVANETSRKLERDIGISGLSLEFMKASLDKGVILKNTDENNNKYNAHKSRNESPMINISMHYGIRLLISLILLIYIVLIFLKVTI